MNTFKYSNVGDKVWSFRMGYGVMNNEPCEIDVPSIDNTLDAEVIAIMRNKTTHDLINSLSRGGKDWWIFQFSDIGNVGILLQGDGVVITSPRLTGDMDWTKCKRECLPNLLDMMKVMEL